MKRRFGEEQVIGILKEHEAGISAKDLCRKHGMSDGSFYKWKARFGGMEVSAAKRLRKLESESAKLKKLVADLSLDKMALEDIVIKDLSPESSRKVEELLKPFGLSERRACQLAAAPRSTVRYRSIKPKYTALRQRIKDLADRHRRFDHPRLHILLRREGFGANHKRTHRIYCEERLQVRKRKPKRRAAIARQPLEIPGRLKERRSMDFLHDQLSNGRRIRVLNIIDDYSCQRLARIVDTSISDGSCSAGTGRADNMAWMPTGYCLRQRDGIHFHGDV